jgi:DNA-binding response OmpR family regulator
LQYNKIIFSKRRIEVETFNNGRSLLDAFNEKPADMLVIDVMMPELDGFSFARKSGKKAPYL